MATRRCPLFGLPVILALVPGLLIIIQGCEAEHQGYFLDPQTTSLLVRAEDALKQHQFTLALALVDSADTRSPNIPEMYFLRGRIFSEMVRFQEAEGAYRKALALRPDFRGAWHNLGSNFSRQYEFQKAIDCFRKELAHHPAPQSWRGIGRAYRELNKPDSSMHAFKKAIEMDSTYAPALIDLAHILDIQGEHEAALGIARRALEVEPSTMAHYLVGSLLVKTQQYEASLKHLHIVAGDWPWHHSTLYNIGQALVRIGRQDEARKYLQEAEDLRAVEAKITEMEKKVRLVPDDAYAHAGLGTLLRRVGRYNDAMHAYQVAISLAPDNFEFQLNAAVLEYLRGNHEAAIAILRRILEKNPDYVEAWINLGTVLVQSGNPEEARRAWEQALRYDPENQMVLTNLEKLAQAQQNTVAR